MGRAGKLSLLRYRFARWVTASIGCNPVFVGADGGLQVDVNTKKVKIDRAILRIAVLQVYRHDIAVIVYPLPTPSVCQQCAFCEAAAVFTPALNMAGGTIRIEYVMEQGIIAGLVEIGVDEG